MQIMKAARQNDKVKKLEREANVGVLNDVAELKKIKDCQWRI